MRLASALLLCVWLVPAVRAADEVTPGHVYQAMQQLSGDINLIRAVTGAPVLTSTPWVVNDAQPRHVFYQAQTLFRKANRFAEEAVGVERMPPTAAPEREILPADVLGIVRAAQGQIDLVKAEYGIQVSANLPALDRNRKPQDVFVAILQASRQLNLMLERRFRPEDVYDRMILASTYVAGALSDSPGEPRYGRLPPFEPAKAPADVYRRVLECLEVTEEIAARLGLTGLDLNVRSELRRRDITPADVYDLATTVLSELAFITLAMAAPEVDRVPVERPKHIFPAHVYQLAGMLQDQLAELEGRKLAPASRSAGN